MNAGRTGKDGVGPVLEACDRARAVIAAIRELNLDVVVMDRGAYWRVLVPGRCVVTRGAIEKSLAQPFHLPGDLEILMPSFKGAFSVSEEEAVWTSEGAR